MIKRLTLAASIIVMLLAISCNKKEEQPGMVGDWYISNITKTGCTTGGANGSTDFGCDDTYCFMITLDADGAFGSSQTINGTSQDDTGSYLIMGDTIEICTQGATSCANYELAYERGADTFTTTTTDGSTGCVTVTTYTRK